MPKYLRGAYLGLFAAIGLIALSLSVLLARAAEPNAAVPDISLGRPVPDFILTSTTGQTVQLSELRGKVVVLYFGSPRCPVVHAYHDRVEALANKYQASNNVVVLAVNSFLDDGLCREVRVQNEMIQRSFLTLLDRTGDTAIRFGARKTSTFYVIGPNGMLHYTGAFDDSLDAPGVSQHHVADAVEALLRRETIQVRHTESFGSSLRSAHRAL